MKIQLKKDLIEQVKVSTKFQINELTIVGKDLEDKLKYCLSKFTQGILDPDVAGRSPDKFITNLQKGLLGDFSNFRKQGVGSMLLSKCINDMYLNNVKEIILDVHTDNKPAYNLYKKFGFGEA